MKKITIAILATLFSYSIASAELGVSIGVSGQVGIFSASGTESEGPTATAETQSQDAHGVAGYTSFFIEKKLTFLPGPLSRLSLGYDHVADTLSSEEVSTTRTDLTGTVDRSVAIQGVTALVTNKAKIDFEDLNTTYFAFDVTDNMYIKAGWVSVDVITKETLGTGSTYGNTSVDGSMLGIGWSLNNDNGFFARFEANHTQFDDAKVTASNTDNFVEMKNLEGAMGKISVGKSF
jgi:hypothetical protein